MSELYQFCAENGNYGNQISILDAPIALFVLKMYCQVERRAELLSDSKIKSSNISN